MGRPKLIKWPRVFKHGHRLIVINNEEELNDIFFTILKEKYEKGAYKKLKEKIPVESLYKPDFTQKDIDKIEIGHSKVVAYTKQSWQTQLDTYNKAIKSLEDSFYTYKRIEEIITYNEKESAYNLIVELSNILHNHDYVEVEVERIEDYRKK